MNNNKSISLLILSAIGFPTCYSDILSVEKAKCNNMGNDMGDMDNDIGDKVNDMGCILPRGYITILFKFTIFILCMVIPR